jgi:hypothetical protein
MNSKVTKKGKLVNIATFIYSLIKKSTNICWSNFKDKQQKRDEAKDFKN